MILTKDIFSYKGLFVVVSMLVIVVMINCRSVCVC